MAENESMEGKSLPADVKKQFEQEVEKVIKDLKISQLVVSPSGFQVIAVTKEQYIVSVKGMEDGKERITPVAIVRKVKDKYEFEIKDRQILELEKQMQKKDKQDVKIDSTAMEIPADKKIGQTDTFARRMQDEYLKKGIKLEGNERFFVKADDNDRYNFRLYAMKADGTVIELPVDSRFEGKNARGEPIAVAEKDGKKIEKKQPLQIMMISKDKNFGLAMFGDGIVYQECVCVTRDQDDKYNGHVLCENKKEQEIKDGSFEVRQGTDDTLGQRAHGDDGEPDYKVYMKLKELEKKEVVNEQDVNIGTVEEVSNAIDVTVEGLMEKYGLNEETAKYVAELVMKEEMELDDALFKGYEIEGQELERQGRIAKGSVYYYALGRQDAQKFNEDNSRDVDSGEKVLGPIERKH